jgi:predicted CoA-binding protein
MAQDLEREILTRFKKIAVVGLSANPARPSYGVTAYMIRAGYDVVGVNPGQGEILKRPCYRTLLDVPGPIEIVNVFRSPEHVPEVVDQAIARGAKAIWLQLGVGNAAAEEKARKAGLLVVSEACIKVEHSLL